MIRDLVKSDDSILNRKISPCGVNCDRHFVAKTLIENMFHYEGVGLSANQIGMDTRAFAMIRDIEYNNVIVCFNPKIIKKYDECVDFEEGCLSYPDKFINVTRPDKIRPVQFLHKSPIYSNITHKHSNKLFVQAKFRPSLRNSWAEP